MASMSEIEKYRHEARVARRSAREVAEEGTQKFMAIAEANMTSLGMGVVQGRGGWDLFGAVPIELVLAGGGALASMWLGDKSKIAPHLFNVALGASCAYTTAIGQSLGKDSEKAK